MLLPLSSLTSHETRDTSEDGKEGEVQVQVEEEAQEEGKGEGKKEDENETDVSALAGVKLSEWWSNFFSFSLRNSKGKAIGKRESEIEMNACQCLQRCAGGM